MNYEEALNGAVFDVGTGENISLNEIAEIAKTHNPTINFDYVEPRKGDIVLTKADTSGLSEIGWRAQVKINDGITECFRRIK